MCYQFRAHILKDYEGAKQPIFSGLTGLGLLHKMKAVNAIINTYAGGMLS